jgi:hypothetical protein
MSEQKSKALTIGMSGGMMSPANVGELIEIAKMIAESGMVPKQFEKKPGAVIVAMQMGAELGLAPMQSIQNIAVINGRPSLWGDAMLALVVSHPDCEDVEEWLDDTTAHCLVKRRGRAPVERTFSTGDANTAGLLKKPGVWTQYPKRMLQLRARGFALRDSFPDVLRGIVTREEAHDIVDQDFEEVKKDPMAEGRHTVRKPKPAKSPKKEAKQAKTAPKPVETEPESDEKQETQLDREAAWREKQRAAKQEADEAEEPTQGQLVPDLGPGEMEVMGMISRAETMAELDVLSKNLETRRLSKKAKVALPKAIEKKRAELQEAGKEEPGADG